MKKNNGYTVSFRSKGIKNRIRGGSVFRTKKEAEKYVKKLNGMGFGISNARSVKATKKEYNKHVRRQTNDIINSRSSKK